jgi:hypothetical protein
VTALPIGALGIASGLAIEDTSDRTRAAIGALLQIVPVVLVYPISAVATALAVVAIVNGRQPALGEAFEPVGERFWPMAAVLVVYTVAVIGGWLAFIIPGVFLLTIWLFAAQSSVIERLPVRAAFLRSVELVRGGWFSVFGTFLVLEIVTGALVVLVLLPIGLATDGLSRSAEVVVDGAATILVTCLVKPFEMIGLALLYLDRRVRLEGAWPSLTGETLPQ